MIKQILASGVHGLLLCHAESPDAVRAFVECCRYPFNTTGVGKGLQVGRRGGGGQQHAAEIWGVPTPRVPGQAPTPGRSTREGELLLGLKIENVRALSNVEASAGGARASPSPSGARATWACRMGIPDAHDPPYPAEMQDARARVLAACKANDVAFLNAVRPDDVVERIDEGVMVCAAGRGGEEAAEIGRAHTKRTMPV